MHKHLNGFMDFIREQGVVGLAVGFILGGAVSKVVTALVTDIINPLVGILTGVAGDFQTATVQVGSAKLAWGDLVSTVIDFIIVATVVYVGVKILGVDRIDKKKGE